MGCPYCRQMPLFFHLKYLTGWRIQLAKHLLLQPGQGIQQVSMQVGYESDEAFSRAFKRHTGEPPASWRAKAIDGR